MKPKDTTSRNIIIGLLVFAGLYGLAIFCWDLFPLGFRYVGTSAYGACRDAVLHIKSYDVWYRNKSEQHWLTASEHFSDGTNDLECSALQIGPFWVVTFASPTAVGLLCPEKYPSCPRLDYHGVSP